MNQDISRTRDTEVTGDWMGMSIDSEAIAAQGDANSLLNARADALFVALTPPRKARRGIAANCITSAATAYRVSSGAAGKWFARAMSIVGLGS